MDVDAWHVTDDLWRRVAAHDRSMRGTRRLELSACAVPGQAVAANAARELERIRHEATNAKREALQLGREAAAEVPERTTEHAPSSH